MNIYPLFRAVISVMNPREAILAVTYRCNCRCAMCNIWMEEPKEEISPAEYSKLPKSLRTVNISGGEPFIRPDLEEVIKVIHSRLPKARLVFSTNGLMTDRIVSSVDKFRLYHARIGVGVSIDGLEDTHDRIRGIKGAYRKAISTIDGLKELGLSDLRIGMTILPENVNEVLDVFELSKELGVEFTATFAHDSEIYFKKTNNVKSNLMEQPLSYVIRQQLKSPHPKDWFRALHTQGIIDDKIREEFVGKCKAGRRYFFMDPYGDVFPCNVMNLRVGNLTEVEEWGALMSGKKRDEASCAVKNCRLDCWMVCNTRSLIISHPFRSILWVLKNKLSSSQNRSLT